MVAEITIEEATNGLVETMSKFNGDIEKIEKLLKDEYQIDIKNDDGTYIDMRRFLELLVVVAWCRNSTKAVEEVDDILKNICKKEN